MWDFTFWTILKYTHSVAKSRILKAWITGSTRKKAFFAQIHANKCLNNDSFCKWGGLNVNYCLILLLVRIDTKIHSESLTFESGLVKKNVPILQ